jgi:hypothetical protein
MKTPAIHSLLFAAGLATVLASTPLLADTADASKPVIDGKSALICAVNNVTACPDTGRCLQGQARAFDLPQFIAVDFAGKEVRTTTNSGGKAISPIKNQETSRNQILLQGIENGHGWTMAIDSAHGRMSVSTTGEDVSYILFGACITP